MVAIAGGTLPTTSFLAGTQVSAFQIAKYEVTWSEWQEVRTWSGAQGRTYDLGSVGTGAAALTPVENVSWYDAVKWCNAKSEKDGLEPVYTANGGVYRSGEFGSEGSGTVLADGSKNGYRLPERSEWEWAARGGASSKEFSSSGSNTVSDVAWYLDNAQGDLQTVGTKAANELGLYDMSGNVTEWCWNDFTTADFSQGAFSFLNGGSVYDNEFLCTFDNIGLEMDPNVRQFGLRLARNATPVNNAPTGISLSAATVAENNAVGATIGTLSTTDADAADTFTYTLVTGTGSTDNGSFTISGNKLQAAASFNFEAKSSYTVRVRSTDQGGLSTEKAFTISVTNVNEAATVAAPASFTVTEDVASNLVWPASPAPFADVDSPTLTVTLAVADGTLSAATVAGITLGGTATARTFAGTPAALSGYFQTAGNVKYTTAANNTVARTLTTTVSDGTLSASSTSVISITPVNDAPTVSAPASFTVTEDVASNLVWPASPAAFADVDSPSLTVTLGVADGTITAATVAGITLGGTATARTFAGTPAALSGYFKTAGNIKYTTAANNTVARTLTTTVSDGTLSASSTSAVSITPVNDAPTVSAPPAFTFTEDVTGNLVWPASPVIFADVDSPTLTVTLAVADGTLTAKPATGITLGSDALGKTFAGTPVALNAYFQTAGNIQYTPPADEARDVSLLVGVSDGTGSALATGQIAITPVNDAPTAIVPTAFTVQKNVATSLVWPALVSEPFADIDSESLTITLAIADGTLTAKPGTGITIGGTATARTLAGTASDLNAYFLFPGNLQYTTKLDNTVARTLTTTVSDGGLSTSKTSTVSINAFAPTATVPPSFTVTEDVAGNLVWPASPAPFADADSTSATVTLAVTDGTITAVPAAGIKLDGPATGRLFIGTIAALNGYFKTAGNIKYTPAANNTVARTLKITVSDGMLSSSKTSTISIKAVNDAPTVASPVSFTVTEDVAGNLVWPASPAPFADVDSNSLSVKLTVTDGTLSAATVAGITLGGTATARTFAGTAAALSGYFKTAGNVKYTTAANNTVARTLTTTVSDGTLSASSTSTISITPANDAPTVSAPTSFTVTEDVAGNLVWPASPAPFADIDSSSLTVTLAVADGTITAATVAGITLGGTATARTFAGTPTALNGYFQTAGNIKYTTAADNTASRTLTTTVSDGTLSASKTSTISITPVNDAPTIWVYNAFGFTTGAAGVARISDEPGGGQVIDDTLDLDPAWKFGDAEDDLLTATFTIDGNFGKLSVRPLTAQEQALKGVTIKSTNVGSTLTFSGKAAALERFFRDGNNVFYTATVGVYAYRLLTASVTDGKLSSSTASWITIAPVIRRA